MVALGIKNSNTQEPPVPSQGGDVAHSKLDVLIVAHFSGDFDQRGNNRINYIADMLKDHFTVELVTSDFSHYSKVKRTAANTHAPGYKVSYIAEPPYHENVSLKRFYSHYVMGRNFKKYLLNRKKPDVIYCTVPPLEAAYNLMRYAEKNKIRFILDVRDIWPEAFKMVFKVPILSDLVFYPLTQKANAIYKGADALVAVSQTYVDRAVAANGKCKDGHCIFLGTELKGFDRFVAKDKKDKPEGELWLAYIGTLSHSYDLTTVIDALAILKEKGIHNIKFVVMGDGLLAQRFERYAKEKNVFCNFTGKLAYADMVRLLSICDIAVNPIRRGSAGSIINKVGDYAAAGLPVLNTQECPEYRDLVDRYHMGLNCENDNAEDLADKLLLLYNDEKLRTILGNNNRKLAEEKFDRARTYPLIVDIIATHSNRR